MSKPESIMIDEQKYVRADKVKSIDSPIKIVILQRGWVMIGRFERSGNDCKLHNASVIRIWGTTKGLGELAKYGPKASTKLDPTYGVVEFDYLTVVASVSCEETSWKEL